MDKLTSATIKLKFANTSIKWSPHSANIFAVGQAENFGVVGRGFVQVLTIVDSKIRPIAFMEQKDAVFDISWFEHSDKFLLSGSGNGEAAFWDIANQKKSWVANLKGEVHTVQCAYKTPMFIAGCSNGVIHFGNCEEGKALFQIPGHTKNCNEVKWHPSSDKVFASAGGDGLLKMWDHTLPKPNISSHRAHEAEILSIDFNKYEEQIVTSSIDKSIRIWDLRNLSVPINILQDHRYPAKRVRFSPHSPWLLGSGSYDMNVHFYDLRDAAEPLKMRGASHTEFVTGLQFNLFDEKLVCSTSWDGRIAVWQWDQPMPMGFQQ